MRTLIQLLLALAVACVTASPSFAQDSSTSGAASNSTSTIKSTQGNQQATQATGGGAELQLTQVTQNPGDDHVSGGQTIKSNPGVALAGPNMSYSNFNCANGTAAGASSWWASFSWSGAKESDACNFRANSWLRAYEVQNNVHDQTALAEMSMADYVTCVNASHKVRKACMQLGLIVNADTPVTSHADTWHACHANRVVFVLCKQNYLVSQSDTFDMKE